MLVTRSIFINGYIDKNSNIRFEDSSLSAKNAIAMKLKWHKQNI